MKTKAKVNEPVNALMVLEQLAEQAEKSPAQLGHPVDYSEGLKIGGVCGLGTALTAQILAGAMNGQSEDTDDTSTALVIKGVGLTILSTIIGSGLGALYTHGKAHAFEKQRAFKVSERASLTLKELKADLKALRISGDNLFGSYTDGFLIETTLYDAVWEIEEAKANLPTVSEQLKRAEEALAHDLEALNKLYGSADKAAIDKAQASKQANAKLIDELMTRERAMKLLVETESHRLKDLERQYVRTLANRKARNHFERYFIKGLEQDIVKLKQIIRGEYQVVLQAEVLYEEIVQHHKRLELDFARLVKGLDVAIDKQTSLTGRLRRSGKKSIDMTYAGAPFMNLSPVAQSLPRIRLSAAYEYGAILMGAQSDFKEGRVKGDWITKRNYTETDVLAAILSKEELSELTEILDAYMEGPICEESINKGYKLFMKSNHTDLNLEGEHELLARTSTLMRKYKRYLKARAELEKGV